MPGINGFLGTRASLMLDIVFLAMFAVLPVMAWSIYLVKFKRLYTAHKQMQLTIGIVLAVAVTLFEIDIRINEWRPRAEKSPYYDADMLRGWVNWSLWVHLFFAITTVVLWIFVIVQAPRKFSKVPLPNPYSPKHIFWARLAAIDMALTSFTGWAFYYIAFVATA
ncbi:MAG: DUF420 domain-containing protein [Pirellulales bacterium]